MTKMAMSNTLLSDDAYCKRYKEIKDTIGKGIASAWTEKTDPSKFVYEDCGIVAYLLELWHSYGIGPAKKFADLGCGNGLLVFLLNSCGFRGLGLDVRERNIWEQFRVQGADLRETKFDPSSCDSVAEHLKDVDFLIGNHSDELTPWIPVIAARLRCNFFLLPCCTYDFFGKYSKKMPSEKALAAGAPKGIAEQHFAYIEHICRRLGFKVEVDQLKIPSRKRRCLVGVIPTEGLGPPERIEATIDGLLSLAKIGKRDFTPRPSKEEIRNCSKLPLDYRMDLVKRVVNFLIEMNPEENIDGWRCGGRVSLSVLAQKLLTATDRQMLADQDKGLQTFLRNQHQIFCVAKSTVSMRKWSIVNDEFVRKNGVKKEFRSNCFFHRLHPDGCPLETHICSYKH